MVTSTAENSPDVDLLKGVVGIALGERVAEHIGVDCCCMK